MSMPSPTPLRRQNFPCVAMALAALTTLTACEDAPLETTPPAAAAASSSDEDDLGAGHWLTPDDPRSPGVWLADRTAPPGSAPGSGQNAARVAAVDAALDRGAALFVETRRMLANRTAQLVDVNTERGGTISPEQLLADLAIPDPDGRKHWFGVIAQAYIELRRSGADHASAVAALRREFTARTARAP
ncbi:hypothetical protein [Methylobrevis albus]|uniref:MxaH protein n=1 Tax=Methylobrevis albus TaxID=2793297 RepID=A0A931I237_9HYPH|nr:hypothetical protein [Methylobrevis albus]MBH0237875.1 hypothetical protein [Methylobrevis albus]